jgi:gluconokinase
MVRRPDNNHSMVLLMMGVAGSGKTLIGSMLAKSLNWTFADADEFHPPANIEKMSRGIPLTDEDREPWLRAMRAAIDGWTRSGENAVLACSALKQRYREMLTSGTPTRTIFLKGSPDLIQRRLLERQNHFMKSEMLTSQFADLEEPADAMVVDISQTPEQIVAAIKRNLRDSVPSA